MIPPKLSRLLNHLLLAAVGLGLLYLGFLVFLTGQYTIALLLLLLDVLVVLTYSWSKAYTWRYLFPGLLGFAVFVIFPLSYTVLISFTNYSSTNLLTYDKVIRYFQEETYLAADTKYTFKLFPEPTLDEFRLFLEDPTGAQDYLSPAFALRAPPASIEMQPADPAGIPSGEPLALREIVQRRNDLKNLSLRLPDGVLLNNTGLREFGPRLPLWKHDPANDHFTQVLTGEVVAPDLARGEFVIQQSPDPTAVGKKVGPGFRAYVGLDNYLKIITDKGIREPFLRIFAWTVGFAFFSVLCSLSVGMFLSVLLEWKELPGRKVYRTLLILPYAVPAFISILIFRGLFNQSYGEINLILDWAFGWRPEWFADPWLARLMILIVNTWLGFPYMMIVCTGILQSVPDTIYEASAIDGSNPLVDFFQITLPLIFQPLFPLLVASFAFNFNNFLLIYLLTGGGPDMVGASTVAGHTDILVSYTFRIAFRDTAQMFGYASAIATLIFIIVASLSWWNLRNSERA